MQGLPQVIHVQPQDRYSQRSKLGYQTWAVAIYQATTNIKGISSMKLHRDLGITRKSVWHLAHRIRKACEVDQLKLAGPVEVDEPELWIRGQRETAPVLAWGLGKPDGERKEGKREPRCGLFLRLSSLCGGERGSFHNQAAPDSSFPMEMTSHHEKPVVEGVFKCR